MSNTLIERYVEIAEVLVIDLIELGEIRAAIIETKANAWEEYSNFPVTERREQVQHSVFNLASDAAKKESEIDAKRVELAALSLQITHG